MKYLLTLLTVFTLIGSTAMAQNDDDAKPEGPSFNFDKTTHKFGELPEGPKAKHEFTFTNDGTKPIIISDVRASCGCTTPKWPKEPIKPGESGNIKVVYDTDGRPGRFTKVVTISANTDSNEKLFIKGNVNKDMEKDEGDQGHDHDGDGGHEH